MTFIYFAFLIITYAKKICITTLYDSNHVLGNGRIKYIWKCNNLIDSEGKPVVLHQTFTC